MDPNVGQLERCGMSEVTPFRGTAVVRSHTSLFHGASTGNGNNNQRLLSS